MWASIETTNLNLSMLIHEAKASCSCLKRLESPVFVHARAAPPEYYHNGFLEGSQMELFNRRISEHIDGNEGVHSVSIQIL